MKFVLSALWPPLRGLSRVPSLCLPCWCPCQLAHCPVEFTPASSASVACLSSPAICVLFYVELLPQGSNSLSILRMNLVAPLEEHLSPKVPVTQSS